MSTRRARIKAVASLPPRRKNAESTDSTKSSQVQPKEELKSESNIPSSTQTAVAETHVEPEKTSSAPKSISSPLKSPSNNIANSPIVNSIPSLENNPPNVIASTFPEKIHVITTTSNSNQNLFVPPQSPQKRHVQSPAKKTPKLDTDIGTQKNTTPEKGNLDGEVSNNEEISKDVENTQKTNCLKNTFGASVDNKSNVTADYNEPIITEDAIVDGIVPLQLAENASKPTSVMKNEIISENAEVQFDPIIPLPSPSKVRPKLRPVPRLAPLRRNSIQGSASESEDESRRLFGSGSGTPAPARQRHDSHTSHSTLHSVPVRETSRIRNDSVCSSTSQATQPMSALSPVKDKHHSKLRRQESSRRTASMRRRRETVKRENLTMYDLIFYNPVTNPIVPDEDEINAKEADKKEAEEKATKVEEEVDDPPAKDSAPVPQIKLGPDGEIVLDEKSLVINQSQTRKVSSVVREGAWNSLNSGRYRRGSRSADWPNCETVRFYRALAAIGTDFMLMEPLFPGRTRRELKQKFKKEERINLAQVDKALRSVSGWDIERLKEEFSSERAEAQLRATKEKESLAKQQLGEKERKRSAKDLRLRQSRGSKALESSILPYPVNGTDHEVTTNDIVKRAIEAKVRRKRKQRQEQQATTAEVQPDSSYATLTLINKSGTQQNVDNDMMKLAKMPTKLIAPENFDPATAVPNNIEKGSLVVLTVTDPNAPAKKMLQTYIAHGPGKLTPIALPATFLNSVVGYMNKPGSPRMASPSSQDRANATPGVFQASSPVKRQRHSSYNITPL